MPTIRMKCKEHCPHCPYRVPHVLSHSAHAIVCIDACFTHKGKKKPRDPFHMHPETIFIPEDKILTMEQYVDSICRQDSQHTRSKARSSDLTPSQPDSYEGPIRVPNSVLDACHESFAAADENRQKASTQFFSETGNMALLCRHDRVLWMAVMTSAGEKQHYVLALLHRLFEHLPPDMTVGLLYDIACKLHRSCIKWGFLDEFLPRITFAVSVFHAYGHQWPCQLIYHPRKCSGFGLTDGEGCERFWSAMKILIAILRICGVSFPDVLTRLINSPFQYLSTINAYSYWTTE